MNDSAAATRFTYVTHWDGAAAPEAESDVLAFWQREGALASETKAEDRLKQIVLHARDGDEVAAVCTVMPLTLPRLGQPMYYYRCFIGKRWRNTRLVFKLLIRAFDVLQEYAAAHDYPCIGVVLELENTRFGESLRAPVWPSTGFIYIGKSGRNLDLRLRYFRGARLKKA